MHPESGVICRKYSQLARLVEGGGVTKPEGLTKRGWSLADEIAELLALSLNLDVIAAGVLCCSGRATQRNWLATLECVDPVCRPATDHGV